MIICNHFGYSYHNIVFNYLDQFDQFDQIDQFDQFDYLDHFDQTGEPETVINNYM